MQAFLWRPVPDVCLCACRIRSMSTFIDFAEIFDGFAPSGRLNSLNDPFQIFYSISYTRSSQLLPARHFDINFSTSSSLAFPFNFHLSNLFLVVLSFPRIILADIKISFYFFIFSTGILTSCKALVESLVTKVGFYTGSIKSLPRGTWIFWDIESVYFIDNSSQLNLYYAFLCKISFCPIYMVLWCLSELGSRDSNVYSWWSIVNNQFCNFRMP